MKAKKLFVLILCTAMVLFLAGCNGNDEVDQADSTTENIEEETQKDNEEPIVEAKETSIDFEDDQYGFISLYTVPSNADESELSIEEIDGSKALKVTNMEGKVPYVAIDIASLVGNKIADVRSITMDIRTEHPDGNFYATSGKIVAYTGEDRRELEYPWSVYIDTKNPNAARVIFDEDEKFVEGFENIIIFSLQTDNGLLGDGPNANFYIENIRIMDASENVIKADSSAVFAEPAGFGEVDWSNLIHIKNEVELWSNDGDGAYSQGTGMNSLAHGGSIDPALIKEGTVFTIYYTSEGNIWLVAQSWEDGAPFAWQRIAEEGAALKNSSGNIAQITYEQMVEACGTDNFETYLSQLQCESDQEWKISSVTIGERSGIVDLIDEVEIWSNDSGDAYGQGTGINTLEFEGTFDPALLQPGSVINIEYKSEGDMWLVAQSWVDGAPFSWQRIAEEGQAADNGKQAQITYEQMVEACGTDDFVTYLSQLQCESDQPWEMLSVTIGYPVN